MWPIQIRKCCKLAYSDFLVCFLKSGGPRGNSHAIVPIGPYCTEDLPCYASKRLRAAAQFDDVTKLTPIPFVAFVYRRRRSYVS